MPRMAQPPLGLAYVASILTQEGHYVRIYDAQFFLNVHTELKKCLCIWLLNSVFPHAVAFG